MSDFNDIEQSSKEWHAWREKGIGASEAPCIMGVGYLTPFQLWQQRLGLIPKQEMNAAMHRGNELEPMAREEFTRLTGIKIKPALRIHPNLNWMRCSLDGLSEDEEVIVEIKCVSRARHEHAKNGSIPPEYFPQLQHQIAVCNPSHAYYFSYNGEDNIILEIKKDDAYIKELIEKEKIFWDCLQDLEPPELIDKDYQERNDSEWMMKSEEWLHNKNMLKKYEELEEISRRELISLSENRNCKGNGIKVSKTLKKGLIDYKNVPEMKSLNLDKYRKPSTEYWRIGKYS